MRGKKLSRQIARYLGFEAAEEIFAKLAAFLRAENVGGLPPDSLTLLNNIPAFFDVIDSSYGKYEENLVMAERNLALSSEELMHANQSINIIVNCLGQGFLMFDEKLICAPVFSSACQDLLETIPAGKHITEVLRLDQDKAEKLTSLLHQAFKGSHAMSFDEIMHFAPHRFPRSDGRYIEIEYRAENGSDGSLKQVVVIASDVTDRIHALRLAEERKASFESIERVLHDRQSFGSYIRQLKEFVEDLMNDNIFDDPFLLQREAHTLKAGAGAFRLTRLMNALHDCETAIKIDEKREAENTSDMWLLKRHGQILQREMENTRQHFKNLLGMDIFELEAESSFSKKAIYDFAAYLGSRNMRDLQKQYIESICTESLIAYLKRYDLYTHDLAERFNKKIKPIHFTGGDIPIIATHYKPLIESFLHIFRNIMDHGIETPDERRMCHKDEAGRIDIAMSLINKEKKQWLQLEIKDDGAGIYVPRVREKLLRAAPQTDWRNMPDQEVLHAIFTHNISTRDVVTHYSGRGLGMNIVYEEAKKLGGTISVASRLGKGTAFTIEVPYNLDLA